MKRVEFVKENCQDKPTVLLLLSLFLLKTQNNFFFFLKEHQPTRPLGLMLFVSRRMLTEISAKNMKICRYTLQSTTKSRE